MTILVHELRQGRLSLWIWTASIASMLFLCMMLYPQMAGEMDAVSEMFGDMGGFTAAFGMDKVNFGDVMGFYAIECGNILGIGGAFFASILGIAALSKEEKAHIAEFLLAHPVLRTTVVLQKLLAVVVQIFVMNAVLCAVSVLSFTLIDEPIAMPEFWLLHLAYTAMQLEIACICFGLSAFMRRGGLGLGIGVATILYFLNILANLSEQAEFVRYITPFAYADAATIVADGALDMPLMLLGLLYTLLVLFAGTVYYSKKDITA